ncbi:MAG: sulfotransferase family 2 domain-containing protein [Pseudomonadota bacterium]
MATFDNRWSLSPGRTHLGFELGGKKIAYAYIRKNACRSFKRALGYDEAIDVRTVAKAFPFDPKAKYDATIFVYRDPIERALSLFRNKFIDGKENENIMRHYRKAMGTSDFDFSSFVTFCSKKVDPHTWTQRSTLRRIRYTHAIPIVELSATMVGILGDEAAKPFEAKYNRSTAHEIPMSDEEKARLSEIYAEDLSLIRKIEGKG